MKKLVLKTIGITVGAILAVILIIYGIMALGFPKDLASFHDGLGNDKVAVKYMAKAYGRTGDIKDLDKTCLYAIKTGDNGLIAEYFEDLVFHEGFKNYCETSEKGTEYYDFIASKFLSSSYAVNGVENDLVNKAFLLTDDYRSGSAAYTLLRTVMSSNPDKEVVALIQSKISEALPSYSESGKTLAEKDLAIISEYLK